MTRRINTARLAFFKSLTEAFPWRWLWIAIIIYGVGGFFLVSSLGWTAPHANPDNRAPFLHLLSAQTQTIGAMFAIVVTVLFVVAQTVTGYGRFLFRTVISGWAIWYLIIFAIAILFPLFLLNGPFFLVSARISLLIGGLAVLLLIPFVWIARSRLDISQYLSSLIKERDQLADPSIRQDIIDIIRTSEQRGDLDTVRSIVTRLVELAEKVGSTEDRDVLIDTFIEVTLTCSEVRFQSVLLSGIVDVLKYHEDDVSNNRLVQILRIYAQIIGVTINTEHVMNVSLLLPSIGEVSARRRDLSDEILSAAEAFFLGSAIALTVKIGDERATRHLVTQFEDLLASVSRQVDGLEDESSSMTAAQFSGHLQAIGDAWNLSLQTSARDSFAPPIAIFAAERALENQISVFQALLSLGYEYGSYSMALMARTLELIRRIGHMRALKKGVEDISGIGESLRMIRDESDLGPDVEQTLGDLASDIDEVVTPYRSPSMAV